MSSKRVGRRGLAVGEVEDAREVHQARLTAVEVGVLIAGVGRGDRHAGAESTDGKQGGGEGRGMARNVHLPEQRCFAGFASARQPS